LSEGGERRGGKKFRKFVPDSEMCALYKIRERENRDSPFNQKKFRKFVPDSEMCALYKIKG
jgi:hypothetical protein